GLDDRVRICSCGLLTLLALVLCSGMLRRGAWPYWCGLALQVPVVLLGLQLTPMWVVGLGFAALYAYGAFKGHQLDREKDAVDAAVHETRAQDGRGRAG